MTTLKVMTGFLMFVCAFLFVLCASNIGAKHDWQRRMRASDDAKANFCAKAKLAVDDLRQLSPEQVLAAEHLAVTSARFCSGEDTLEDLSDAFLSRDPKKLDQALQQLSSAFDVHH